MALTADELESDIRQIGAELAGAFPSSARHPLRTLDARAMDLAARDRELRAALFRFVDVVPACRSLDDVARHLRDFLEEVPDAPPPIAAAMRIWRSVAGSRPSASPSIAAPCVLAAARAAASWISAYRAGAGRGAVRVSSAPRSWACATRVPG